MRIVLASDLHYGNMSSYEGDRPFVEGDHVALAAEMHRLKPDLLVITGDVAETIMDVDHLSKALEVYRNPHGDSLMITGNHDVWCLGQMDPYEKFWWNVQEAQNAGWKTLVEEPWERDGVYVAGGMGWYNYSCSPKVLGLDPMYYESTRGFSDFHYMGMRNLSDRTPMLDYCDVRMGEFERCVAKVPEDRKALIVASHYPGYEEMLTIQDTNTAFFGNTDIGDVVRKAKADVFYCGHTHMRARFKKDGTTCVNNGSGYGHPSKTYDVIDVFDDGDIIIKEKA